MSDSDKVICDSFYEEVGEALEKAKFDYFTRLLLSPRERYLDVLSFYFGYKVIDYEKRNE